MTSITVRIPDDLKKDLDALGVEVSGVTRSALESEVKRLKRERAEMAVQKLSKLLADVPDEVIIRVIKESREER